MFGKTILALSVIGVFLAGCGGNNSDSAEAIAVKPVCVPKVVTIQGYGDSTRWGLDSFTHQQAVPSPSAVLQEVMDSRFGTGAVRVLNQGANSSTTRNLLDGTDGVNAPYPANVMSDIQVFNHGINDQDFERGESIDDYESNLRKLAALSPGRVVFETPNDTPGDNRRLAAYAQRMRDTATALVVPLADTYAYVKSVPGFEAYFADFAHPNAAMYEMIARNSLAPVLLPIVSALRCEGRLGLEL